MKSKFEVGQWVFIGPSTDRHSEGYASTITKIGRKWISLGPHTDRFDPVTMQTEYRYSSRRVYLTRGDYLEEKEADKRWRALNPDPYNRPTYVTLAQIEQIRAILTSRR